MFRSTQLSAKTLGELCHRLAVETESGIDIRRTWQREAESAPHRVRDDFARVRDAVGRGDSLSVALASVGGRFPRLFLEMVDVGEKTGTLANVFRRLAQHFRQQQQMRRSFLLAITWPMIQLTLALLVVGVFIWVLGIVAQRNNGQPIDVLGFGLLGSRGLAIYIGFLIAAGLCIAGVVAAIRRGLFWTRPLERAAMHTPVVGDCLLKLGLARLTWVLHLTMNTAMDLRQVLPLAFRATGYDYFIRHADQATAIVAAGHPLYKAFSATGVFPAGFIDAVQVAEESGRVVESMERLSRRYEDEAETALGMLTSSAGFVVWLVVGALIVLLIFRIAGFYIGTINDALKM